MLRPPSRREATLGAACLWATAGATHGQGLPPAAPDQGTSIEAGEDAIRRLTVPVLIGREGPFPFVVDTGANRSVISAELASALTLPARPPISVNGIAGVETVAAVAVPPLEIGGLAARRSVMPAMPASRLGAQGLLGVDMLKNRRVEFDFVQSRLTIGPSGTPPRARFSRSGPVIDSAARPLFDNEVVVPARQRNGQLMIIDADLSGHPIFAFIDSGAESTVGNLRLRGVGARPGAAPKGVTVVVTLMSAMGQTIAGDLARLPTLRFGGLGMRGLQVVYADLHPFKIWGLSDVPAMLVGMDVLRHFHSVVLDFGRSHVRFRLRQR